MNGWRGAHEALTKELDRLKRNSGARSRGREFPLAARWNSAGTEVEYLYRNHQLICDEASLSGVLDAFAEIGAEPPAAVSDGPVGLKVLDIGDRDAADLADELGRVVGEGVVTVNHVLDTQGHVVVMCPASEPVPWQAPLRVLGEPVGPGRPRLAVVDTGYLPSIAEQSGFDRFGAVTDFEVDDEVYFADAPTDICHYGGHGTAATGRLLAVSGAGSVSVKVRDCVVGGAVDELTIVEDLVQVVSAGVDVISLQAGLYARAGRAPLAFDAFHRLVLRHHPEIVIVAAAGNNGSDAPFWPAAYPWTTAVGSLTSGGDARPAWTNYGHWVDVYAPGENVVVAFPNGSYEYEDETRAEFTNGHALWSGTSFSAPVVAGLIARRMVERGVDAPTARDIVLEEGEIAMLPGVGRRVLLP